VELLNRDVGSIPTTTLNSRVFAADAGGMIAVVHIHKTAGTTLAGVFKRSYGPRHLDVLKVDRSTPHLTPDELSETMDRFYPRLDSINAHPVRIYSGLEAVVPDIEYISFLRNPIERTASHYQYDFQVGGVDLPFEEWIQHEAVPDRQTKILAGPDAAGEDAIALLPRFSFIGRSDAFNESLVMMQRKLSIPDIRYRSKWVAPSNEIKKRLLSDPVSIEKLASVNREDTKVWDHFVSEVYPKQQAEFGSDLDQAVADFENRNSKMNGFSVYTNVRYLAYVAKWRLRYRPWVRKMTGDPTAG
jgi:hypothetical protein